MKKEDTLHMHLNNSPLLFDMSEERDIDFPPEFLPMIKENGPFIYNQSKKIMGTIIQYKELLMMYTCALKEIRTRFEILNAEFSIQNRRNPINFINTRLKSSSSIIEKMKRNRVPISIENVEENIDDVAGIRVICSYVDDIFSIAQALINQKDVELISQKDYITNPKPNGYRSMHMIVSIPIHFENEIKNVKVEVQIRTIAMDFWATLEHEMLYKNQMIDKGEITAELRECAEIITGADTKMLAIRKRIEENHGEWSEEDDLVQQLRKLDLSIS